jgi:hypothetical protein
MVRSMIRLGTRVAGARVGNVGHVSRSGCSVSDVCDVPERLYIAAADGTAGRID